MQVELKVLHNQTLLDIAIQEYGTATGVFALAVANEMNVTDTPVAGSVLKIPDWDGKDKDVAGYFKSRKIYPATATPLIAEEDIEEWIGGLPGMLAMMLS